MATRLVQSIGCNVHVSFVVPSNGTWNRVDCRLLLKERMAIIAKLRNDYFGSFGFFFGIWIFVWIFLFKGEFCLVTIQVSFPAEYYTILYLLSKFLSWQNTTLYYIYHPCVFNVSRSVCLSAYKKWFSFILHAQYSSFYHCVVWKLHHINILIKSFFF